MIEEYGTLSEEELIQEIMSELEESDEIDPSDLDFKFEDDKLKISGTLQDQDELEVLISVLEDYVDPKDYQCDVELLEEGGVDAELLKDRRLARERELDRGEEFEEDEEEEDEDDEDFEDEDLEEVDEEELDFDDMDEEDEGDDKDKW